MARANPIWKATVLTLFPEMFPGPLAHSLAGQGLAAGAWALEALDIRDFAEGPHRSVDDAPFGGGPGMVMRPDVVARAVESARHAEPAQRLIYLTPRGRRFAQATARELAGSAGVTLLCGRYEGLDERVVDAYRPDEISLGDFVLSGGEAAAVALIDACVRLLPGVVGKQESLAEESFEAGLLEYPQYTRPQTWQGRQVPDVLVSGHHEKVRAWRRQMAEKITRERRPDLWARYAAERH